MTITLTDVQKFIAKRLKADAEFSAFCTATIGDTFTFHRDTENVAQETLPFLSVLKLSGKTDMSVESQWTLQFYGVIAGDAKSSVDGEGIYYSPASDNVDAVMVKAIERIECLLLDFSINNSGDVVLVSHSIVVGEVGEGQDQPAVVTMVFAQSKYL